MHRIAQFAFLTVLLSCVSVRAASIPRPIGWQPVAVSTATSIAAQPLHAEFSFIAATAQSVEEAGVPAPLAKIKTYLLIAGLMLLVAVGIRIGLAFRLRECL